MTDRLTVRLVVVLLGLFALTGLAGLIWLVDHDVEGELLAIVATPMGSALGALSAVLVSTRSAPEVPPGPTDGP